MLFVYGTLRRGAPMHGLLEGRVQLVGPALAAGRLLDLGDYPGFVAAASRDDRVVGELYSLHADQGGALLASLDRYEGPRFQRERAVVEGPEGEVAAWLYRYCGPVLDRPVIPGGDFLRTAGAADRCFEDPRGKSVG